LNKKEKLNKSEVKVYKAKKLNPIKFKDSKAEE
jgi:hypothetical protein